VFKKRRPPKSLNWREIEKILFKLGAVFVGDNGDHKKYKRTDEHGYSYVITLPTYSDVFGMVLDSTIRQSGVSKREFWDAYYN